MKTFWKNKWLAALRSGKYKQGTGSLHQVRNADKSKTPQYCCLGVLANLPADCRWIENEDSNTISTHYVTRVMCHGFLSDTELARFGLSDEDQQALVELNDTERRDFRQIADWIEQKL